MSSRSHFLTLLAALALTGAGWNARQAFAACAVSGPYMLQCDGTSYWAVDDQGVFFVDLTEHQANQPGVPLPIPSRTLYDLYGEQAVIQPVVVHLTDYVDCTLTDHNFQEANLCTYSQHPNKPSRLMSISGKTFRVTAAPDAGFATYYYSYDVATGGTAGVPHLLVAQSSNDQERYTTLSIHHPDDIVIFPGLPWAPPYTNEPTINPWGDPWWEKNYPRTQQGPVFGPDVGLTTYTGRELAINNQPFNISMIFHAKTTTTRVVVSSLGCNLVRTSSDGGAVSQMWVFELVDAMSDRYPVHMLPDDPTEQRYIGIYMTHPWYFYAHYGTPVRVLTHRQQGLQRLVQHMKFCGFNYIAFNAINGSDRTGKTWYQGGAHFDWNSAGDLLVELPPIAEAEGIKLVPIITSLKYPTYTAGLSFSNSSYQLGTDGDYTRAFGNQTLDPLRSEVQQLTFNLLSEIASRTASSPAVRGIGIRANGKIGTCYTSDEDGWRGAKLSGYSSWDLQQFKNDTGSGVPTSPPGTAYDWLRARPTEWESWINWRCQRTRQFWLACRDLIKSYRSDLIFYVQCDLPSETPGTNIEWPSETPYNLLRHHGYDPLMFQNDTGIVISRGMMVAEDRFYVRTRWAPPWGQDHDNYRLFHYAEGLPEMYFTAEGRACEMYQNYWEEHQHPYWEFGSCGPSGVYFRTATPAALGNAFLAPAVMSLRRQNADTMVWLGWNRPTLGHETDLRRFAIAFRALPKTDPVDFEGTVSPSMPEVWVKWFGDRLAVVNDTSEARTITLSFTSPVPLGQEIVDLASGKVLMSATQANRSTITMNAEAWSLQTLITNQVTFTAEKSLGAGWHLISLPIQPSDPAPSAVFSGIPIDGTLYRWDHDIYSYVEYDGDNPTQFGDCELGVGYWLHLYEPATISYTGTPSSGTQRILLPSGGWRLIGQPMDTSTTLGSCIVTDLVTTMSQSYYDAAADGWIAARLWGYDAGAGGYIVIGPDPWHAGNALQPWSGYWVWSADMDLALDIPRL